MPRSWLVLALVVALVAACSAEPEKGPLGNGIYIGVEWQEARAQAGHQTHVVEQHIPCSKCHSMGESSMGSFTPERCAACHEQEARISHAAAQAQGRFGAGAQADCSSCHVFRLHTERPSSLDPALAPGGASQLPPPDLTTEHAYQPEDCFRCHAERQGATPAVVVHSTAPCVSCHQPHSDVKLNATPCSGCHSEVAAAPLSHGAGKSDVVQVCTTCHQQQHARSTEALGTCVECHSKQQPLVPASALFEAGHRACVGCHQPHAFETERAVDCTSCHADLNLLGGKRIKAHQACTSCHQPHDVRDSAEQACAGCHKGVHPDHPKTAHVGQCVSCHDPHPAQTRTKEFARSCSDCHQKAASDRAFHENIECSSCHTPHRFVLDAKDHALCSGCHSKQVALAAAMPLGRPLAPNAAHQNCEGCHAGLPHQPKTLLAGCASCHGSQATAVRKGHNDCQSCHEPHGGRQVAGDITSTCASCHRQERLTAPAGHQPCQSCHEPHTGERAKACASCHAEQAKTPHGEIGADCASCHRPHGPTGVTTPPGCVSCHEPQQLPGLHRMREHQTCSGCHTGHGELLASTGKAAQVLDRQACGRCHEDKQAHFPDAPSCTNCHLFNPTR